MRDAIGQLKQAPDIEEPTARESREALHLDQDIQDVAGSPDLARTIFDKIDLSQVVVADVTIVGSVLENTEVEVKGAVRKELINSNVAIESDLRCHRQRPPRRPLGISSGGPQLLTGCSSPRPHSPELEPRPHHALLSVHNRGTDKSR